MNDMTVRDIVGLCPEEAIWKMMVDISEFMKECKEGHVLAPGNIAIDGDSFFVGNAGEVESEFLAPEQDASSLPDSAQVVWSLGAVAYYAASGHVVFGGHGGCYQRLHPNVPLPTLPKSMRSLTPVIQRCLCSNPSERIGLEELNRLARKGLSDCSGRQRERSEMYNGVQPGKDHDKAGKWPEEMMEI